MWDYYGEPPRHGTVEGLTGCLTRNKQMCLAQVISFLEEPSSAVALIRLCLPGLSPETDDRSPDPSQPKKKMPSQRLARS